MNTLWLFLLMLGISPTSSGLLELPHSFVWNGQVWQVAVLNGPMVHTAGGRSELLVGGTLCEYHLVLIDVNDSEDEVRDTLQHELFHVIDDCSHNPDDWTPEEAVSRHSRGLTRLKRDNPELRKVLP